jgi:hypothetical protein
MRTQSYQAERNLWPEIAALRRRHRILVGACLHEPTEARAEALLTCAGQLVETIRIAFLQLEYATLEGLSASGVRRNAATMTAGSGRRRPAKNRIRRHRR